MLDSFRDGECLGSDERGAGEGGVEETRKRRKMRDSVSFGLIVSANCRCHCPVLSKMFSFFQFLPFVLNPAPLQNIKGFVHKLFFFSAE